VIAACGRRRSYRVAAGPRPTLADGHARKIDKMLMDDPPQLNFYNGAFAEAVSDRVKGYVQSFTGRRSNLRNVTVA
jgi:hypothetical protein